jgi:hypothetical protein
MDSLTATRHTQGVSITMRSDDEAARLQLETDFPGWYFWRAVRCDGEPRSWMATRTDPNAGPDPTVMADTAEKLRAALEEQRRAGPLQR